MGIQEAEIEVFLDEYIREKGNKDKALFYLVSEENNEKEVKRCFKMFYWFLIIFRRSS